MLLREGIWRAVPQLKLLPLDVLSCKWLCSQNRGAKSRAAFDGDEVHPMTSNARRLMHRCSDSFWQRRAPAACAPAVCALRTLLSLVEGRDHTSHSSCFARLSCQGPCRAYCLASCFAATGRNSMERVGPIMLQAYRTYIKRLERRMVRNGRLSPEARHAHLLLSLTSYAQHPACNPPAVL